MYYAVFDDSGNRITSYNSKVHDNIPDNAIPISDEEQQLYCSGYVRDPSGKPIPKPQATPTPEEAFAAQERLYTDAVQGFMDAKAQEKGYDNIHTAASYAAIGTVPQFQAEGIAYGEWRSKVWAYCYLQLARIKSGERQDVPSVEQLIAELAAEAPLELPE